MVGAGRSFQRPPDTTTPDARRYTGAIVAATRPLTSSIGMLVDLVGGGQSAFATTATSREVTAWN